MSRPDPTPQWSRILRILRESANHTPAVGSSLDPAERRAGIAGLIGAVLAGVATAIWSHPAIIPITAVLGFLLVYGPVAAFYGRRR